MPESIRSDNIASISLSDLTKNFIPILESLRDLLARRLVQEYHSITDHDLNYTIFSSILQVLFLRTGKDCGFVEPGTLSLLAGSDGISRRMARACSDAGFMPDILFEKGPDASHLIPDVPDDSLREVIRCMDSEKFPVPISTLPIGHLAVMFENFLGTRMQVAEGYRVKRAGKSAVLYTGSVGVPLQAAVEYIVNKTISDVFRGPETGGGTGIRILDPACGAGIFLLAAYRDLVHCKTEQPNRPEQRRELLQDLVCQSVYGTDIDPEYVSTARFIILLSFIEECRLSGYGQVLPDRLREICECLKGTIRCGNALIAKDYFSGLQEHPFNAEERRKVNAFSWQEAFPYVLDGGGFDAVIGAPPPYQPFTVKARDEYFQTHYDVYAKGAGLYGYFIEKGLKLLRPNGSLAFCIPDTFFRSNHARSLRRFLLTKQIEEIVDFGGLPVFKTATMYPCIIRVSNNKPSKEFSISTVETLDFPSLDGYVTEHRHPMDQRTLTDGGWTLGDKRTENLLKKLQNAGQPLEEYMMGGIYGGVETGFNEAFVIDGKTRQRLTEEDPKSGKIIKPFLIGRDIKRYQTLESKRFLIFTRRGIDIKQYPAIKNYLKQFKPKLMPKPSDWKGENWEGRKSGPYKWYEIQDSVDFYSEFEKPKIIFLAIQVKPAFTFDATGMFYINKAIWTIPKNDLCLLGILNSKLGWFLISNYCTQIQNSYQLVFQYLGKIPIYTIDFDNPDDKTRHNRMVRLVTEMLELHKHLSHAKTDQEKQIITQEIESTDRQIDSLVYGLYRVTADEIKIIEEWGLKRK
jgi:Eco57I restriction-modification methylase/TaqI-like C-terminal specificity domain